MANTLRIKRRAAGGAAGAPTSLANAELAFNEQDNTLYYGTGTGGAGGTATSVTQLLTKLSGTRLSRARQFFYHCLVQRIAIKDPAGLEADIEDAVSLLRGRVKP